MMDVEEEEEKRRSILNCDGKVGWIEGKETRAIGTSEVLEWAADVPLGTAYQQRNLEELVTPPHSPRIFLGGFCAGRRAIQPPNRYPTSTTDASMHLY